VVHSAAALCDVMNAAEAAGCDRVLRMATRSVWLSASSLRKRVHAVMRDQRVSICVSSIGTAVGAMRTVTYKGTCALLDDAQTKRFPSPLWPRAGCKTTRRATSGSCG
jgi:hypothetical protein